MDPPDDDIQFDFFDDEPATTESPGRLRTPRVGRKPRGPSSPPHQLKPVGRLLALVLCFIFLLLVFALLISSCAGQSKKSTYGNYMNKFATIASQSSTDGVNTVKALTTPGLGAAAIVKKLNAIAAQEAQNVTAAQGISPPGKLRGEHMSLIESLALRESGV